MMKTLKLITKLKHFLYCMALAFALVATSLSAQAADLSTLPDDDQLALHQGRPHGGRYERHSLHHGMGRAGKGICPQSRETPEAPGTIIKLKNPLQPTRENLAEGENLYHYKSQPTKCKVCHGANGNGLGMMALGSKPMPTNFTCAKTMEPVTDGQMFWIIKNGSPESSMPPYKLFLSDEQIWKLVLYIRTLVQK